jgi:RNA polymerase sigma factor (sigma-70 family)
MKLTEERRQGLGTRVRCHLDQLHQTATLHLMGEVAERVQTAVMAAQNGSDLMRDDKSDDELFRTLVGVAMTTYEDVWTQLRADVFRHLDFLWPASVPKDYMAIDDLANETIAWAYEHRHLYDVGRGRVKTWLFQSVARTVLKNYLGKLGKHRRLGGAPATDDLQDTRTPESACNVEELLNDWERRIGLKKEEREVLELMTRGLTQAEIARELGRPEGSINNLVFRIRQRIKALKDGTHP